MKLWIKIALLCAAVLLLVVGVCSLLLLSQARNSIMQLARDSTQKQLSDICVSVSSMVSNFGDNALDPVAKRSLIKYYFSKYADSSFVLTSDTETLYSQTALEPEKLTSYKLTFEGTYNGQSYLIYGSRQEILGDYYTFYIIKDLSDINNSVSRLVLQFTLISAGCIALGIFCIIMLVRYVTRPLKDLSAVTGSIASGEYSNRAAADSRDEVGTLARDFNIMADAIQRQIDELKETAERQELFIGGLTHELKTPITSMMIHSETLLYTKMSAEETFRSLSHIHDKCQWLERLAQKLLKLITLREEAEIKQEQASKLLDLVRSDVAELFESLNIKLDMSYETDCLEVDIDLIRSALVNLVVNAARASSAGQIVSVRVCEKMIEVVDHGKGIPKDELNRITEPFYMVDRSRSKKAGGSGLGLALVKRIAQAHHANLIFESEPGKGTTARICFP